jgi:hypothetical protein
MTTTASSHPASPTNSIASGSASSSANSSPEYLILSGAPGTGKTGTLIRLTANFLLGKKGFTHVLSQPPTPYPGNPGADFLALFERQPMPSEVPQRLIRVVVNTGMDRPCYAGVLKKFLDHCRQLGKAPDIIITAGRDANFHPSPHFWKIMGISPANPNVIQVPLAKITRRGHGHSLALTWYRQQVDALLEHILSNAPFNI